jgi:hypothetical protein
MSPGAPGAFDGVSESVKSLTPAAILAVGNINKELTPQVILIPIFPSTTICMVNGRLMANPRFNRNFTGR